MSRITIINDTHLGVRRNAGTTPASAQALTLWQEERFTELLGKAKGTDLVILGDLFDSFTVDYRTLLFAYDALVKFLEMTEAATLHLVAGNHDLSKDSSKLGALHLLYTLLYMTFESDARKVVKLHVEPGQIGPLWVIPHQPNQDLFDLALEAVPAKATGVLLHANYDNYFAQRADHSLNLSEEQAQQLPGWIIVAHEHQFRTALDERLIVVGNQIPTSVSDCLGADHKYYAVYDVDKDGVQLVPYLVVDQIFRRVDWQAYAYTGSEDDTKFIRVEGEATANQAADVVTAIAWARKMRNAFVITNAVKVEGSAMLEGLPESLEKAKEFDVMAAVLELLDDEERTVVQKLMQETA